MPLGRAPENPYHLYICIYVQTYASVRVCRRVQAHICCNVQVSWILMKKEGEFSNFLYRCLQKSALLCRSLIRSYSIQHPVDSTHPTRKPLLVATPEIRRQLLRFWSASVRCEYLSFPFSLSFLLILPLSFLSSSFYALSCRGHPHALLRRIAPSWCRAISAKHAQPSTSMGQLHCRFLYILHCRKWIFNFSLLHFQTWRICRCPVPYARRKRISPFNVYITWNHMFSVWYSLFIFVRIFSMNLRQIIYLY